MTKRFFHYAIFLVGFLFIVQAGAVQAQVSLPDFSQTSDLPGFISSVYSFALTIVGIAVFIQILYAGFLMLTAAGNASKWGDAKNKMQNAVIGAILLFAAYLILYVINPDLVKNTFNFNIPGGSQRPSTPSTPIIKTSPTAGPLAISGIVAPGQKPASFRGLPIARAQEGIYVFTIKVVDRNGDTCDQTYNMEVMPKTAAIDDVKKFAAGKYQAALLNAVSAQIKNEDEIVQTVRGGGCVITTTVIPDAVANVPYFAEIYVAGEAPYAFNVEDGRLPEGLGIVPTLDMPILTIKNLTARRTPTYAFKVGDTFRLDLTGAKPDSGVYFKWYKNGAEWFYPGITPNDSGWSEYGTTDGNGDWINQAAFTSNEIGTWQEYAMVDGKVSRAIEFHILDPAITIVVSAPVPGSTTSPINGGRGGGCQTEHYCEDRKTGERSDILSVEEAQAQSVARGSFDRCPGRRQVYACVYPSDSLFHSACDKYLFEARNCVEEVIKVKRGDGTVDTSNIHHSDDVNPPADVSAGSLYTVDQYAGKTALGGSNILVKCRYSNQVEAVNCGNFMAGEHCLPDGRNAGWNETWCAGKVDSSGNPINPSPAPTRDTGRAGSRSR